MSQNIVVKYENNLIDNASISVSRDYHMKTCHRTVSYFTESVSLQFKNNILNAALSVAATDGVQWLGNWKLITQRPQIRVTNVNYIYITVTNTIYSWV